MNEMSRPCPVTLFNNKLTDFVDDLSGVLGHLPEYTVMSSSVRFLSQFQPRQNQDLFNRFVATPYGASVMKRDERFLLEERFQSAAGGSNSEGVVSLIKSVWKSLPPADRESIWAHMHVLIVLNERCLAAG